MNCKETLDVSALNSEFTIRGNVVIVNEIINRRLAAYQPVNDMSQKYIK